MSNTTALVQVAKEEIKGTGTTFYDFAKEVERKSEKEVTGTKTASNTKWSTGSKYSTYKPEPYVYKGTKNKTDFPEFVNICKMSAKKLKEYLCGKMKDIYGTENTMIGDGYIYCRGDIPVLVTAHMDTVHKYLIKDFYEDIKTDKEGNVTHTISSPQGIGGDDRCGIYAILKIIEAGYYPYILFCEQEEDGGIGSAKFCRTEYITELSNLKFLLELDRANANDLVFYDNDNKDWIDWVEDETNWKKSWGTFSDISHLSPACEISSVNLSCGYYKAHTTQEYVIVEEMLEMIEMVKHLLDASEGVEAFEYKEKKYNWWGNYGRGYGYGSYNYGYNYSGGRSVYDYDDDEWDDYVDNYYYNKVNNGSTAGNASGLKSLEYVKYELEITFVNEYNKEEVVVMWGESEADCWMNFFFDYPEVCFNDVIDFDLVKF